MGLISPYPSFRTTGALAEHQWDSAARRSRPGPGGVVVAGIGDAGQASPLGGGWSWPPVRWPVQRRARPGDADRGVRPGRG